MAIHLLRKTRLALIFLFIQTATLFSQRGFDDDDYEGYNWNRFNSNSFFLSAIVCAAIISFGLYLQKNAKNKFIDKVGNVIVWIGGIAAFGALGGPILGAIDVLWKVFIGLAVFVGIIYWIQTAFLDKKE